jgi:hypothetical protein
VDPVHAMEVSMPDRFQQNAAVEAVSLEDEAILFHPDLNQFCILNRTASVIWSRIAQPATSEEIAAEVSARFAAVTEADAQPDVEDTLRQMADLQLITRV